MTDIDQIVAEARAVARSVSGRWTDGMVVLAAGGTGGHMMPAQAVAEEMARRQMAVHLITDARGDAVPGVLPGVERSLIDAKTGSAAARGIGFLGNIRSALRTLQRLQPSLVIGFGGYPSAPALAAARLSSVPFMLHEQNAVLGRVNRRFARSARAIALGFEETDKIPPRAKARTVFTGNPIRDRVSRFVGRPYDQPIRDTGRFRLLVVGGSQGARILSDVVPDAVALLPPAMRDRITVTQQCRPEDLERVARRYEGAGVPSHLEPFLPDLPDRIAASQLVIARAGASTIAELAAIGRPSVLVPLGIATDDHQQANAAALVKAGGAWMLAEKDFNIQQLAKMLQRLIRDPEKLSAAAQDAHLFGKPQAAMKIVDLAQGLSDRDGVTVL